MNAFDLINIMGGMTMSRLVSFQSDTTGGGSHATHAVRFLTRKPAESILSIVKAAFSQYEFELERENLACYKLRYKNHQGAQGLVVASVQVRRVSGVDGPCAALRVYASPCSLLSFFCKKLNTTTHSLSL